MDPILLKTMYDKQRSILNSTNFTADQDIIINLPRLEALTEPYQTMMVVLYTTTAGFAFTFNLLAIVVLVGGSQSHSCLKKYLINLAVSDILMGILSVPFSYTDFMYGYWVFPAALCPISSFASITCVCGDIFTLIVIGIERSVNYNWLDLLVISKNTF